MVLVVALVAELLVVDELVDEELLVETLVVVTIAAIPHTTALIIGLSSLIISKFIFVSVIDFIVAFGSFTTSILPLSVLIKSIFAALSDANSIPGIQ